MIGIIVTLLSVLLPLVHLGLSRHPRTRERVIHLLLLYALVLDVGVVGLILGFIPHVFFPDEAAQLIGWPPGSPFQFEVGLHDGAWGLLGFLSLWIGGSFWIATGLGWSVFMLGPHTATSIRRCTKETMLRTISWRSFQTVLLRSGFWCCCTCTAAGENFRGETEAAGESSPVTVRLRVHEPRRVSRELPQLSKSG